MRLLFPLSRDFAPLFYACPEGDQSEPRPHSAAASHNPVWDQLRGRRGGRIDLSFVRVADNAAGSGDLGQTYG
jgi:hypothetical protein